MEEVKLTLVFYIYVRLIEKEDIPKFKHGIAEQMDSDSVTKDVLYIPIYGESRVECINPVYITNEDLIRKHERLMAELHEHLNNQLNNE